MKLLALSVALLNFSAFALPSEGLYPFIQGSFNCGSHLMVESVNEAGRDREFPGLNLTLIETREDVDGNPVLIKKLLAGFVRLGSWELGESPGDCGILTSSQTVLSDGSQLFQKHFERAPDAQCLVQNFNSSFQISPFNSLIRVGWDSSTPNCTYGVQ